MGEGFWVRQRGLQKEGFLFWAIFAAIAYGCYSLWGVAWAVVQKLGFSFFQNPLLNFGTNLLFLMLFLQLTGVLLQMDVLRNFVFGILKLFPMVGSVVEAYEKLNRCKEVEFELVPGSQRYTLGWIADHWTEGGEEWCALNNPLQAWPGGDTWKMRKKDLHFTGRSGFHTYLTCLSGGLYIYPRWERREGCSCKQCRV
jgi:hypothetical protein